MRTNNVERKDRTLVLMTFLFYLQVPTIFWWDNFDKNVDKSVGSGSIQTTPKKYKNTSKKLWLYQDQKDAPLSYHQILTHH